jgi:hypothetical protein
MSVKVVNQFGPYSQPLSQAEILTYGADAVRDSASGFVFEQGVGAPPRAVQAAEFQRRLCDVAYLEFFMSTEKDWPAINPDLADIVRILKAEKAAGLA